VVEFDSLPDELLVLLSLLDVDSEGVLSLLDLSESLPFLLAPFSTGGLGRP
jgi:hypothetical protein